MKRLSIKGFTLIELLVVVAIIGILVATIIPSYLSYISRGFNSAAQSDLKNFKVYLESYYADNHQYPVNW